MADTNSRVQRTGFIVAVGLPRTRIFDEYSPCRQDYIRVEDHPPRAALKLLFMAGITQFTYGDEVCVINGEYKGRKGAIVGMNDPDTPLVFTIEFGDGSDAEVPLESLEIVETDVILPPDSLDDENGNCKQCGHPFNPHIIVANDANDFSKGGEMRCPVENCECFATVHFDMKDEQGA